MKCQILFSGKNKKNISKCRLLKILPRVLSVKLEFAFYYILPCIKPTGLEANSEEPNQMSHSAVYDLGLHRWLRPVCLNNVTLILLDTEFALSYGYKFI